MKTCNCGSWTNLHYVLGRYCQWSPLRYSKERLALERGSITYFLEIELEARAFFVHWLGSGMAAKLPLRRGHWASKEQATYSRIEHKKKIPSTIQSQENILLCKKNSNRWKRPNLKECFCSRGKLVYGSTFPYIISPKDTLRTSITMLQSFAVCLLKFSRWWISTNPRHI